MNYSVITSHNKVTVLDEEALPLHTISQQLLQETVSIDGSNCSGCIINLADRTDLPTHVLYKVAYHIQNYYPFLYIDWFTTFYHVEKSSYLNTSFFMKEMLEGFGVQQEDDAKDVRFDTFKNNDDVYDVDTIILKIVMMNIISFNVIVR